MMVMGCQLPPLCQQAGSRRGGADGVNGLSGTRWVERGHGRVKRRSRAGGGGEVLDYGSVDGGSVVGLG